MTDQTGQKPIDISVIIPAKDEEKRLGVFLTSLVPYCKKSSKRYEIIVVDDGSRDKTSEIARAFACQFPEIRVIQFKVNRGKGAAVREGFFEARGDIVLFTDADGATPCDEIEKNLQFFDQGYDVLIGSRAIRDATRTLKRKIYRRMIGKVFRFLVHVFLIKDIQDTQCGFKMFRRGVVKPVFEQMTIERFGFDLEILYLCQKMGFKIKETPVSWSHVTGSRINLFSDSLRMFCNILEIRWRHRQ